LIFASVNESLLRQKEIYIAVNWIFYLLLKKFSLFLSVVNSQQQRKTNSSAEMRFLKPKGNYLIIDNKKFWEELIANLL
jgi:hypothetical protein